MKRLISLCLFIFVFSSLTAQELQFPNTVIVAGGSHNVKNKKNVSRWRIGHINILQIPGDITKSSDKLSSTLDESLSAFEWNISAYPNPVSELLQIEFEITEPTRFGITVTDITGRKVIETEEQLIIPNQVIQLDFKKLISALYIVNIRSENDTIHKILKVSKH